MKMKDQKHMKWFDWTQMQKDASNLTNAKPDWIENYVQKIISQALSSSSTPNIANPFGNQANSMISQANTFETHDEVIVRLEVPEGWNPKTFIFFANPLQLKIMNTKKEDDQIINLPKPIQVESVKGEFKEGVFEFRLLKEKKQSFKRVYVDFL